VRNIVEQVRSDDMDRGIMVGRHNMRGVFSKGIYEGGAQERDLAAQYKNWADISRQRWPRMALVLDTIAKQWEEYAKRADEKAEQAKLRY
jgi:alpha/beta superfamily hydrolase